MSVAEKRLERLGLAIVGDDGTIRSGAGNCQYKIHDDLLFITGLEPKGEDGRPAFIGRLGREYTREEGYQAARLVAVNMLTLIKDALGDLDRVDYFIKVMALVNTADGFADLPEVADGFTDVMTEVFGERGMHARTDLGATNLNNNVPIICDAIIKIGN
jgi:enamine deaminase RidA (YjgF/YER057c/UK114 family)